KQPKQFEIDLVNRHELEAEFQAAQKAKKEAEKGAGTEKGVGAEQKEEDVKEENKEETAPKEGEDKAKEEDNKGKEGPGSLQPTSVQETAAPQIKEENTATKPGPAPAEAQPANKIIGLIAQAKDFITKNDKQNASHSYDQIREEYKNLPVGLKQRVIRDCVAIQNGIARLA
ncbi:MAG: hypothetical protein QS98_C0009G0001, partial [archaeon GW2011_AR3]